MLKSILSTIVLGTALVGCQSTNTNPDTKAAAVASTQAVACSKCEVKWVKVPHNHLKGNAVAYTTEKRMTCPDCKDAVENFFTTGHLKHDCKSCGPETMQVCAH